MILLHLNRTLILEAMGAFVVSVSPARKSKDEARKIDAVLVDVMVR